MAYPFVVLSGPVGQGKTSWLQQHLPENSQGILTPVKEGKRIFQQLGTAQCWPMEARAQETEILLVGRYRFSRAAFDKAEECLQSVLRAPHSGWLVLDEVGPLELSGRGFHAIAQQLQQAYAGPQLWVVRDRCLQEVIEAYQLAQQPGFTLVHWQQLNLLKTLFSTYLCKNPKHGLSIR